jgi:hypothetical protein
LNYEERIHIANLYVQVAELFLVTDPASAEGITALRSAVFVLDSIVRHSPPEQADPKGEMN